MYLGWAGQHILKRVREDGVAGKGAANKKAAISESSAVYVNFKVPSFFRNIPLLLLSHTDSLLLLSCTDSLLLLSQHHCGWYEPHRAMCC